MSAERGILFSEIIMEELPTHFRAPSQLSAYNGKTETSGRMTKWTIGLNEYDISYHPRAAIKAQALIEFIHKATLVEEDEGIRLLHVHGSCSLAGVVLTSPEGDKLEICFAIQLYSFK
ncbi:hypothetical protein Sango_0229400 [Sesamum angolense]|uniref:Uncharacterized protein n=1 Tax=Sesamum angolense TaxID=2727404 RepID=A0AAE1XGX9_9LAMI|nr:hypothetical protein Sango_0229400 [Sesamum angolense]